MTINCISKANVVHCVYYPKLETRLLFYDLLTVFTKTWEADVKSHTIGCREE